MTPRERSESKPSRNKGFFATLRASISAKGTRAPSRILFATLLTLSALALTAAPALAAPPETPETGKATAITATTATLNGLLNPLAPGLPGSYQFSYAPSETKECTPGTLAPAGPAVALGAEKEAVSVGVTELQPNREYAVCLTAFSLSAEPSSPGAAVPFKTSAAPPEVIPSTESATAVNSKEATLNAEINAENQETQYAFEYSTTEAAGNLTGSITTVNGATPIPKGEFGGRGVSVPTGAVLAAGTTYFYRVVATNEKAEKTEGEVKSLTTVPTPNTDPVTAITATTATFNGHLTLNPLDTQYSFDYNTGPTCTGVTSTLAGDAGSGPGTVVSPNTPVTGLLPHTTYTVCFVTSNAFGSETGPPVTFTTLVALPTIESEFVTELTASSATLGAQINPGGAETTYRFQYGTTESYGQSTPSSPSIGSDDSGHPAAAHIQGLAPATLYHYRVLATNTLGTVEGPDQTFTTQGPGGTLMLPDGRAWEMVSPAQKLGAQVDPSVSTVGGAAPIQASEDGSAISYAMSGPFGANPAGNARLTQAISTHTSAGWSSEDIATPHTTLSSISDAEAEYRLFSSDLSRGLVDPFGNTPLPPLAQKAEKTVYLRNNAQCTPTPSEPIPATCYLPLVTAANVPPGTEFGEVEFRSQGVHIVTATPDLSHVVLVSSVALTPNGTTGGRNGYYEWANGKLAFIGTGIGGHGSGSNGSNGNTRRAVSNDGSRIFGNGSMVDMTDGEVVSVGGQFQIASADGSLAFFSSEGGLYAYNAETRKRTLITVTVNSGEEPSVQGLVLGASEDGSYVYLVARGVLTETPNAEQETARAGGDNLYVLHREVHGSTEIWTPSFITTLSAGDERAWTPEERVEFAMGTQTEESSPDGRYLAFMSDRSLTGYDNRDASSGERDEEVYRYDALGGRLVCASCDPSGARPAGWFEPRAPGSLSDRHGAWADRWVAATIPGLEEPSNRQQEGANTAVYQPRYMLDSGRLFFDSHDALVPQDVNGVGDVYEYESGGEGGCAATSGGCVALLSGGTGPEESAFGDSSASGSDVFFVTADRLAPQDIGNEYDMYDAHVCSAAAPCPTSAPPPPPCTTADSCKAAIAPQPGVFGAPASATFSGAGNVPPAPPPVVKPKTAAQIRAEKLARALKACKKVKRKSKRLACGRQARKRYGPPHRAKKTVRKSTNGKGSK